MALAKRRTSLEETVRTVHSDVLAEWEDADPAAVKVAHRVQNPGKGILPQPRRRIEEMVAESEARSYGVDDVKEGTIGEDRKESMRTIERRGLRGTIEEGGEGRTLGNDLASIMASTIARGLAATEKRRLKAMERVRTPKAPKPRRPSVYTIRQTWWQQTTSAFPKVMFPAWSPMNSGQAKHLGDRIGIEAALELMPWAITNWVAAIATKPFAWMKKQTPPPIPEFGFFCKFAHLFDDSRKDAKDKPLEVEALIRGVNRGTTSDPAATKAGIKSVAIRSPKPILQRRPFQVNDNTVTTPVQLREWRD